jgi:hypothetical protein
MKRGTIDEKDLLQGISKMITVARASGKGSVWITMKGNADATKCIVRAKDARKKKLTGVFGAKGAKYCTNNLPQLLRKDFQASLKKSKVTDGAPGVKGASPKSGDKTKSAKKESAGAAKKRKGK